LSGVSLTMNKSALLVLAAAVGICPGLLAQQSGWPPASAISPCRSGPARRPAPANPPLKQTQPPPKTTSSPAGLLSGWATSPCPPSLSTTKATTPARPSWFFPEAATTSWPSISKAPKSATGSTHRRQLRLLKYRVPGTGPYPKSRPRLAGCAARPRPGARACNGMGHRSQAHRRPGLLRRRTPGSRAQHSLTTSVSTTLSMPPTSSVAGPILPSSFIPATWPSPTRTSPPTRHKSHRDTPPTFIVQAEDDPVHVENAMVYFMAAQERQGSGRAAHLCAGRPRLRPASHRAAGDHLAAEPWRPGCIPSRCARPARVGSKITIMLNPYSPF
jgi:hypothetical protein